MKHYVKQFPSGLRMFFHQTDKNSQVSINIAVKVGSVNESEEKNGISHFIEHALFLGSEKRDARQINVDFDNIGAEANAYTSRYLTCFYASCLREKSEECMEILSDMVLHPAFREDKLNKEKKVICSEIDRSKDNYSHILYEEMLKYIYDGTPSKKCVIGSKTTVRGITRDDISQYYKTHYIPSKMIVCIVGPLSKRQAIYLTKKYVNSHFASIKSNVEKVDKTLTCNNERKFFSIKKDTSQDYIRLAFPIENCYSEKIHTYEVMSNILGGGASSRLFSRIREELGLVYSVYSGVTANAYKGIITISLGVNEQNTAKALSEIKDVVDGMRTCSPTREELERAKLMLKTDFLASMESKSRISDNAVNTMATFGEYIDPEVNIKKWEQVTLNDVNDAIKMLDFSKMSAGIVSKNHTKSVFKVFEI